jgi:hypothetical protein
VHYFFPIVSAYVLNLSHSHWLLFNALQSIITMCLKCREEVTNPPTQVNFIKDCSMELSLNYLCLLPISRRKLQVFWILFSFFKKIRKKKLSQNVKLILDPRFKSFYHFFLFIGHEEGVSIEYDRG